VSPLTIVLPLLVLAVLLVALLIFLNRAGRALRYTREVQGFQREAADLGARMDRALGGLVIRIDAVRRRRVDPGEIVGELDEALGMMEGFVAEAEAIKTPAEFGESRALITEDLSRGLRALEMVRHGVRLGVDTFGRSAELEANTAIKRGYLNLLHAREAVLEHTADLAEARDPGERRWRTSRT
jgi:hypothetical protein